MARPCVGCGFQVDSNGYLAINGIANVTYPYAAATSSPNDIFCDSTSNELWVKPWSVAWGVVGTASITTANQTTSTTPVLVTGAKVTFTPVVNRRYRTTVSGHRYTAVTNEVVRVSITDGTVSTELSRSDFVDANSSTRYATGFQFSHIETFASTSSVSRQVAFYIGAGGSMVYLFADSTRPVTITVEDVGPV